MGKLERCAQYSGVKRDPRSERRPSVKANPRKYKRTQKAERFEWRNPKGVRCYVFDPEWLLGFPIDEVVFHISVGGSIDINLRGTGIQGFPIRLQ